MTTLYPEAPAQSRTRDSRKIGNTTTLERSGADRIGVLLHSTHVLIMSPDYVELDSGGWHTKTTWSRMSDYGLHVGGGKPVGVVVLLRDEGWATGGHPYFDGIRLTPDGTKLASEQPRAPRGIVGPVLTERGGW